MWQAPALRPVVRRFPYSSTLQGGPINYALGSVSVRLVRAAERRRQGSVINRFYSGAGVTRGGILPKAIYLNVVTPLPSYYIGSKGFWRRL